MDINKWKSLYGKGRKNRPGIIEITEFLPYYVSKLFREFSEFVAQKYNVGCKPPRYTETYGWVYFFGRYDVNLINQVTIQDNAFTVNDIYVNDENSLQKAFDLVASLYNDYKKCLDETVALKKGKQKINTQKRIEREKGQLEMLANDINKEMFNKYRWSPKLSRQILQRLYNNDAKGVANDELADEVGYALYSRCLQGRDERILIEKGKLKCHHCDNILQAKSMSGLMQCSCGHQYIFRDYMRSFRKDNMPSGAATAIFNAFINNWEQATDYANKMRLIDNLIHEFHTNLNSGVKGRFVGINLIEGTKSQIRELILNLAYGNK